MNVTQFPNTEPERVDDTSQARETARAVMRLRRRIQHERATGGRDHLLTDDEVTFVLTGLNRLAAALEGCTVGAPDQS